jgi:hypothetical protein
MSESISRRLVGSGPTREWYGLRAFVCLRWRAGAGDYVA